MYHFLWHSTNTVAARGIPPYDATFDASCGTFVASRTFRAHWREMQRTLTTPATPNNKPRPVAASDLALPQIHEAVRLAYTPRKKQPQEDTTPPVVRSLYVSSGPLAEKFRVLHTPKKPSRRPSEELRGKSTNTRRSGVVLDVRLEDMIPSELTKVYVATIARREDFDRRQLVREEKVAAGVLAAAAEKLRKDLARMCAIFGAVQSAEHTSRTAVVAEEEAECARLVDSSMSDERGARRREEKIPKCPAITTGQSYRVTQADVNVDVSWRGGTALNLVMIVFDSDDKPTAAVSFRDGMSLKGADGSTALRHSQEYTALTDVTDTSREIIDVYLDRVPENAFRMCLCAFNALPGGNFQGMHQGWVTLKAEKTKLVAFRIQVGDGTCAAMLMCTFTRTARDLGHSCVRSTWDMVANNETFARVLQPNQLQRVLQTRGFPETDTDREFV